ncbi:MAG: MarR family transcriptional regulator [Propionibacteriales bacterium]|nr:MarR family transcriptional regulator [Propionibacteriales bacterium]
MPPKTGFRWLSQHEQLSWRAYLRGTLALTTQLDKDLQKHHDLSLSEYEILAHLSETPEHRLRMSELATYLHYSRSRLSHTVSRMEKAGLVVRYSCPEDGRGILAELTKAGRSLLEIAAHTHVEGVRRYLVDPSTQQDFAALGRVFDAAAKATKEHPL